MPLEVPINRWTIAGGVLVGVGALIYLFRRQIASAIPDLIEFVDQRWSSIGAWAADRGDEVRALLGLVPDRLRPEGTVSPVGIDTDTWNAAKIETLIANYQPAFSAFMADVQAVARRHGEQLMIWEGGRSLKRQLELYRRGRTDSGKKVTYVIGSSEHVWGIAIDLQFRAPDGNVDFRDPPSWYYNEILPLASRYGLESLYLRAGKDPPHIEVKREMLPLAIVDGISKLRAESTNLVASVGLAGLEAVCEYDLAEIYVDRLCPTVSAPVRGADGKTYRNVCLAIRQAKVPCVKL